MTTVIIVVVVGLVVAWLIDVFLTGSVDNWRDDDEIED